MKRRINLLFIAFWLSLGTSVRAQMSFGDMPETAEASDATITKMGHATVTMKTVTTTNPATHVTDTTSTVTKIEWDTEKGTAKRRMAMRDEELQGTDFYDEGNNWWYDIYWYSYNYPSIDPNGEPLLLSSMACMPDEDCDHVNNVIIGCHYTITSNAECPTLYNSEGSVLSDVSLIMKHAGSGTTPTDASQNNQSDYNLVILPDYEGYGLTRDHSHPYLYEEITARQVIDAVRYGIALYNSSSYTEGIRHPFRDEWRSICLGYSQGGGVALATQRFIEQNGLTDELHLAGSVCGDGPYDLMSTLYYYARQCAEGSPLAMPVVMPLLMKSLCDCNPYMKNHKATEYFSEHFVNSGIFDWLTEKEKNTTDIENAWISYYSSTQYVSGGQLKLYMSDVLNEETYNYIHNLYASYPSYSDIPLPEHRGWLEDMHFALASNSQAEGWAPQHAIVMYHSYDDNVVPELNRESVVKAFGDWTIQLHASISGMQFDHIGTGVQFFTGTSEPKAVKIMAGAPVHQTTQDVINLKSQFSSSDLD